METSMQQLKLLNNHRDPTRVSASTLVTYERLAEAASATDNTQDILILNVLRKAGTRMEYEACAQRFPKKYFRKSAERKRCEEVAGSIALQQHMHMKKHYKKPLHFATIPKATHALIGAQLDLASAVSKRDKTNLEKAAVCNNKIALVFAAFDPDRVSELFSHLTSEEIRMFATVMRKLLGKTKLFARFESKKHATEAFMRMLTSLKGLLKEQLRDKERVISSCQLLQQTLPPRLAVSLSSMLAAEYGPSRSLTQEGGGWVVSVFRTLFQFIVVILGIAVSPIEIVLSIPIIVCSLIEPAERHHRCLTNIAAFPKHALTLLELHILEFTFDSVKEAFKNNPSHRDRKELIGFLFSNFGKMYKNADDFQTAFREWQRLHTPLSEEIPSDDYSQHRQTKITPSRAASVLGLDISTSNSKDIKRAFQQKARENHPDNTRLHGMTEEDSRQKMQEINEAHAVLKGSQD